MISTYRFEDPETGKPLSFNKGGKPVIYLFSRDANRQRKITKVTGFKPHFWVADKTSSETDLLGRPIRHLVYENPMATKKLREGYPYHDESKVLFWLRYLVDKKILCGYDVTVEYKDEDLDVPTAPIPEITNIKPCEDLDVPPLRLYFDLEVEAPPEILPRAKKPVWPIVSFQFSNNYNNDLDILLLDCKTSSGKLLSEVIPEDFSVTVKNKFGETILRPNLRFFDNEPSMVHAATKYVDRVDPDVPTGWNSDLFDFPYWIRRAKKLHVSVRDLSPFGTVVLREQPSREKGKRRRPLPYVKGRDPVDMLKAYRKWTSGRQPIVKGRPFGLTYDFKIVVEYETGLKYEDYGDRVAEVRHNDPIAWVTYCTIDGYALKLLDRVTGLFKHYDRLRRLYGVPVSWALYNSRLCGTWLLRIRDKPLPTKTRRIKKRSKGAFVLEPEIGLHEMIALIDLKTMYPIAIIAFNLSPETKDPNGKIIVGPLEDGTILRFKKRPEGLLPRAVRMTYEEREKYRAKVKSLGESHPEFDRVKQLETLYKFLCCSYFGVTGYENFVLFDEDVKKAILYLGRRCLLECKTAIEKAGYDIVYGDTDSLFVRLRTKQPGEGRILERIVNDTLMTFALRHGARYIPEAKYEECFKRILFKPKIEKKRGKVVAAKKRYAGITVDGRLVVVGLEPRRSSTAAITRKTMLQWLDFVLLKNDVDGSVELLRKINVSFSKIPINEIAIPKGLHKEKYATKNPWRDGCDFMQKHYGIRFREDKKPMLIYLLSKRVRSICITEDMTKLPPELMRLIDWRTMKEKVLRKPFEPLLKAIGIEWADVETNSKQVGLAQWQE